MGYSKKNFLKKVKDVQDIYQEYHRRGYTNEYIYKELIRPKWLISRTTFYNYLSISLYLEQKKEESKHLSSEN
jgi:hypothetical protein